MALSSADDAAEEAALAAEEAALAAEEAALEAEEAALANELARMKAQDKVCRHFSNLESVRSCLPALAISHPCVQPARVSGAAFTHPGLGGSEGACPCVGAVCAFGIDGNLRIR